MQIAVTGHPGTGRDTVARALRRCFGVRARRLADRGGADGGSSGSALPPDLAVHVLGAAVRDCDLSFLRRVDVPIVAVLGKCDLRGGAEEVRSLVARAARDLGRPVFGVSGPAAAAQVTEDLRAALADWAVAGRWVPVLAASFVDVDDPVERARRTSALAELGGRGLAVALERCAAEPTVSAAELTRHLRGFSGIGALAAPVRACAPVIAAERERRHRRALTLLAARGGGPDGGGSAGGAETDRDRCEADLIR
ncbi:MAG: hypothetical protein QM809_05545 [Gordonia sp. (in: high G+C Gram-positive bacteria)]|uniref:hypothetical protein n=1 Tax=Gordonia sp. (in: high G+C Gram-positive bacteria) TaxID=84139 RepID=UPI0039E557E5